MCIAPQNHRDLIFFTKLQDLQIILSGIHAESPGIQRIVIDLKKCMVFFRRLNNCLIIQRIPSVIRMSDHIHMRIFHRLNQALRIPSPAPRCNTGNMQAGNRNIHPAQIRLVQIHISPLIQNVQFDSQQNLQIPMLPLHHLQIMKVKIMARPRHPGRMLRDSIDLQSLFLGRMDHLHHCIIRMPAGNRMCVYIQYVFHGILSPSSSLISSCFACSASLTWIPYIPSLLAVSTFASVSSRNTDSSARSPYFSISIR